MFCLVDYTFLLEKGVYNEFSKKGLKPIAVFTLEVSGKDNVREKLENIRKIKENNKFEFSAVIIRLDIIDNFVSGLVLGLRRDFDLLIGFGGLNKINRYFLETCDIDFLLDPHNENYMRKSDFVHHFNSGINQVLANMAKEKEIGFLLSLSFLEKNKFKKELGRIKQNLKLAEKFKVEIAINPIITRFCDIREELEIKNIGRLFDLREESLNNLSRVISKKIEENTFKRSPLYISRGIEVV